MNVIEHLQKAASEGASDLFLIAGAKPSMRINGRMNKYDERLSPEASEAVVK